MAPTAVDTADPAEVPDFTSNLLVETPAGGSPKPERPVEVAGSVQPADRANSRSSWQILKQPDFRSYFIGSLISNLGTWLQSTAQVLIAYQVTRSVFMVGLIASAQFAGMIVVSPWAPVLADRFSPRAVLVGTQCFSAIIAVLMLGLHLAGKLGVSLLLAGALGLGFAFALALPVQTALVPALVREEDAADAVKMNSVSYNAGRALAPALCVPMIIFIGPDLVFFLNAVSFMIFAIILRRLPCIADGMSLRRTLADMLGRLWDAIGSLPRVTVPRASLSRAADPAGAELGMRPRARVRDGVMAALQRRRLLLLLAIVAAVTLADDPILVLSPSVAASLHLSSASAGYFIAALGWGSVLGSLRPTSVGVKSAQYASKRAAVSLLVLGLSVVVFTMGLSIPASLIAAAATGAAALFTGTAAQTALLGHQNKTGADVAAVASVAALWAIAWAGTKPFASLLDGWLASHIGIVATSVVLALPAISIALCELLLSADIKRRVNDYGGWIAAYIACWMIPGGLTLSGAEPQPLAGAMTLADGLPFADRVEQVTAPRRSKDASPGTSSVRPHVLRLFVLFPTGQMEHRAGLDRPDGTLGRLATGARADMPAPGGGRAVTGLVEHAPRGDARPRS